MRVFDIFTFLIAELQPFFSWLIYLLSFYLAVRFANKKSNFIVQDLQKKYKGVQKVFTICLLVVCFKYFVLHLIFNLVFKNLILDDLLFLTLFAILDFKIIPLIKPNYSKLKEQIKSNGYKSISKIEMYLYVYFRLRKLYIKSIIVRFPLSILSMMFFSQTFSHPSFESYNHDKTMIRESLNSSYWKSHEDYRWDYTSGFYVPFLPPINWTRIVTTKNYFFKKIIYSDFSIQSILCMSFNIEQIKLIRIGVFNKNNLPSGIQNDFNQDTLYTKGLSSNQKVFLYYYFRTKPDSVNIPNYFYYYACHEVNSDSLDFNFTKMKSNIKHICPDDPGYVIDQEATYLYCKIYRPNYIDY